MGHPPDWYVLIFLVRVLLSFQPTVKVRFDSTEVDCFYVFLFLNFKSSIYENLKDLEGPLTQIEDIDCSPVIFTEN